MVSLILVNIASDNGLLPVYQQLMLPFTEPVVNYCYSYVLIFPMQFYKFSDNLVNDASGSK